MGIIYKATHRKSGMTYIGYTTRWPLNNSNIKKVSEDFRNDLLVDGEKAFEWFILLSDGTKYDRDRLIKEYYDDTLYSGTRHRRQRTKPLSARMLKVLRENAKRMRLVGHTEETKALISAAQRGKPKSEAHRAAISENHASKRPNSFYTTEEYRRKMSEACKGKSKKRVNNNHV